MLTLLPWQDSRATIKHPGMQLSVAILQSSCSLHMHASSRPEGSSESGNLTNSLGVPDAPLAVQHQCIASKAA